MLNNPINEYVDINPILFNGYHSLGVKTFF